MFVLSVSIIESPDILHFLFLTGNGPSAIALSYLLAGNAPIYSGTVNDDLLHARLSQMPSYPITLQDLKELSEVNSNVMIFLCHYL